MRRLLAVLISFALLSPVRAADIKSVPEIKADVNPTGAGAAPAVPSIPATPGTIVPDLAAVPTVLVPEMQTAASPGTGKLQPLGEPKAGIDVSPGGRDAAPGVVENQTAQGQVQFDQARLAAPGAALDPAAVSGGLDYSGAPALARSSRKTADSDRGPPDVDGVDARLERALDRAVAKGEVTPKLREELLDAAYRDPLTGLRNRLYLDANLAAMTKEHRTLATFKLDSLKEINDSYDHETGNRFIKALAAISAKVVGPDGVVVRRSPTGFAVFLDAPAADARLAAEALRLAVSRKIGSPSALLGASVPANAPGGTVSIGVSALSPELDPAQSYREAFAKAEGARQKAKEQGGGDRVAYDDGDSKLMDRRTLEEAVAAFKRSRKKAAAARLENTASEDLSRILREDDAAATPPRPAAELIGSLRDPELREAASRVIYQDRLSGLYNRRYLFDHLEALLNAHTSFMAIDIDKFGDLNAIEGEERADLVLRELGLVLSEGVKDTDSLALHPSGEEFIVLGGPRQAEPKALGEELRIKVRRELGRRVFEKYGIMNAATGRPYDITISIGVAPIKHAPGSADHKLELINAMAESLLQRAKANGRDRVEVGAEGLTAMLARLVRVDETVRKAVSALAPAPSRQAQGDAFLDNSFKSRREVLDALRFNPASEPGVLLSEPEKGNSETILVSPKGRPKRVVKISDQEVISNEILLRGIVENFEVFNRFLASPRAVAYTRVWPFKPVLVQENVDGAHKSWMDSTNLPLSHKIALSLLAGTFGVFGFNPGALLEVTFDRSVVVDFEMSRGEFEVPKGPLPVGAGTFHPWVSETYLNDFEDYRPALKVWKETFAKDSTQSELARLMRRARIPEGRIAKDLAVFRNNLSILEQSLKRDIATGNRDFRDAARRAGLDTGQAAALSVVNKSAHSSPQGGILRDLTRMLNGTFVKGVRDFALTPEEWKKLAASRPDGLSRADRERLLKLTYQGNLTMPLSGTVYSPAAVRAAISRLNTLVKARG